MNWSYWEKTAFIGKPDVVIIGSGIVGLSTAIELKTAQPSLRVMILERGVLPYGASTRNAGFACYGSMSELMEDLEKHPHKDVFALVERRWKGLVRLRKRLGDNNLKYEPFGGYEVFTAEDKNLFESCLSNVDDFNKTLESITGLQNVYQNATDKISSFGLGNVQHMIENSGEGQIDTGSMMQSLIAFAKNLNIEILNGIQVSSIKTENNSVKILSDNCDTIEAHRVIITTNGFAKQFLPSYEVEPARAQVLVTEAITGLQLKGSFHYDHGYYYFRNIGNRILFGGARNLDFEAENTTDFSMTDKIQNRLDELLHKMIAPGKNPKVEMRWSGIMGIGPKKSPIVQKVSDRIFCAVRMGGMGVALGSLVGEDAAKLVMADL